MMRRDTVNLVNQAIEEKRQAYVLVRNRSEGNAPLTVQAIWTNYEKTGTEEVIGTYTESVLVCHE